MVERFKLGESESKSEGKREARVEGQHRGRFFFLIFLSLLLTNLGFDGLFGIGQYFSLFSLLAPVPLAMAILAYGRRECLSWSFGLMVFLFLGAWFIPQIKIVVGAYFFTTLYAFFVTWIIQNNISPFRGIFYMGMGVTSLIWLAVWLYNSAVEGGIHQQIVQMVDAGLKQIPESQMNSKALVDYIKKMGPVYLTITPFLSLWVCFFLLMRNSLFWKNRVKYSYSLKDMASLRAPDGLIYPLAVGLGLTLMGNFYEMTGGWILMGTILMSLSGVFYFFQGFGVFLSFLDHFKIVGFLRSFFIIFAIIMAQVWLALLGIADNWLNLREFFKKSLKEGDKK